MIAEKWDALEANLLTAEQSMIWAKVEIERLTTALQSILTGEYPRIITAPYHADGKYSKLDRCKHGVARHDDCPGCIDDYIISVIGE